MSYVYTCGDDQIKVIDMSIMLSTFKILSLEIQLHSCNYIHSVIGKRHQNILQL